MASQRKFFFERTLLPAWEFAPLVDWGDPALDDTGALGFSLLPRRPEMAMLENARTFFSVRMPAPGLKRMVAEKMFVVPRRTKFAPHRFVERRGAWTHVRTATRASLYGLRSNTPRSNALGLSAHYMLSHESPAIVWQIGVLNRSGKRLRVDTVTLLRVGPPQRVSRHRRTDFNPARFRLFKLRRPPQAQSAYYDLTERFGSLRLHALEAPRLLALEVPAGVAQAAVPLPDFSVSYALVLRQADARGGMLLAVDAHHAPGTYRFEANTDRFAPGLTLRWQPEDFRLPAYGTAKLPKIALVWLSPEDAHARALLHHT